MKDNRNTVIAVIVIIVIITIFLLMIYGITLFVFIDRADNETDNTTTKTTTNVSIEPTEIESVSYSNYFSFFKNR